MHGEFLIFNYEIFSQFSKRTLFSISRFGFNVFGAATKGRPKLMNVIADQINSVKLHTNVYACIQN